MTEETKLAEAQEPVAELPSPGTPSWAARLAAMVGAVLANPKAPLIAGGLIVALGAFGAVKHFVPNMLGSPNIVLFDPVKFLNAQRAAASILAVSPSADLTLTMTQVAKQSEAVIREEAHGAVVIVKQAVVVPEGIPDITDAVLTRFGLPTKVPTVTAKPNDMLLESVAPTDSAFSQGKLREDYRIELDNRNRKLAQDEANKNKQDQAVP